MLSSLIKYTVMQTDICIVNYTCAVQAAWYETDLNLRLNKNSGFQILTQPNYYKEFFGQTINFIAFGMCIPFNLLFSNILSFTLQVIQFNKLIKITMFFFLPISMSVVCLLHFLFFQTDFLLSSEFPQIFVYTCIGARKSFFPV